MSPTSRSLELLREMGYRADVVERWIPGTKTRRDLFGFIDIVAIKPGLPILAIQATSSSNSSARERKSDDAPALRDWLEVGAMFQVWGWGKRGKQGKRKLWTVRRRMVRIQHGRLVWCTA